jgi:hypothetical protein
LHIDVAETVFVTQDGSTATITAAAFDISVQLGVADVITQW